MPHSCEAGPIHFHEIPAVPFGTAFFVGIEFNCAHSVSMIADMISQEQFGWAVEQFAAVGVDAELALQRLGHVPVSIHCWQGDDVGGFEGGSDAPGGGLAVTGNHPGKARNIDELWSDTEKALSLIPGRHRLNLHASYGDFKGQSVERDAIGVEHFQAWIDWAKATGIGLDFNPTFFGHPKSASGWTLAHPDAGIREFWIEHGKACRRIAKAMGQQIGYPCINNFWIPDGYKDSPADRLAPRERLAQSLDTIFSGEIDPGHTLDSVECKLFGIGSESYVVGSHEFYLGYAISRQKILCLDNGHFHPTEMVSDKISAVLPYVPGLLLHVSRGLRWDSDHVVILADELTEIAREIVRSDQFDRIHIGLDFFDASINRVAAWVIGTRNMLKALMTAFLEPGDRLRELESAGDYTGRLALMEDMKMMPYGILWEYYCQSQNTPGSHEWLNEIRNYEKSVLALRG